MSKELLTSIAQLIRQPGDSAKPNHLFPNLNELESKIIKKLGADQELNKYGREQADQRWEYMWNKLPILFTFVENDVISDFWFDCYEPHSPRSGSDQNGGRTYTCNFLEFLLADLRKDTPTLSDKRPWLSDLVKFEQAVVLLGRPLLKTSAPQDSRFKTHYRLLELDYDIASAYYLSKKDKDQESTTKIVPLLKKTYLLMIFKPDEKPDIYQLTDKDFKIFEAGNTAFSPEKTAELKEIGLL